MNFMNRTIILRTLNEFAINRDEKPVIVLINKLINEGLINEFKDLFFKFITSTQFYGYIEYLNENQKRDFLRFDFYRSSSYKGLNMSYYNRGQLSLLNQMQENRKVFVSAPTSFGKTSLIMDLILENRDQFDDILMVIPTNSLIEELFLKFNKVNNEFRLHYRISTQPRFIVDKCNLLILTPERFLVLAEEVGIDVFNLILMDETYKIVDFNNPSISDFVNRRSYRFRKIADMIGQSNSKILFLSPYTYKMKRSMLDFLEKYSISNFVRKIDYVSHKIVKLTSTNDFYEVFGRKGYRKNISIKEKTKLIINALGNEKSIVYVSDYSSAYEIVDKLTNRFTCLDSRYICFLEHMKENYSIPGTPVWKVIEGLEKGVGIYIAPLPRYIKKEIVNLYDIGALRTMIVTTAFTEGINTDAEHLIITTLVNGPKYNKLTELDLLNTVGRAGRFAKKSIGKVYCITEEIFDKVCWVKNNEAIELYNENYVKHPSSIRNDYEIDMINEVYLNDFEKQKKHLQINRMARLGLTKEDLDISLNVSNDWKLQLYEKIATLSRENINEIIVNVDYLITQDGNRTKAIDFIFRFIKDAIGEKDNPFPQEFYEIRPFDKDGGFTWGRLYELYSTYTTKVMIQKNMEYIIKKVNSLRKEIGYDYPYKVFEMIMNSRNTMWICSYINKDFSLRYDKFYTEAFKFVSSIIQYKIPYYVSFFVSIVKLYLIKNNLYIEFAAKIDLNDIVSIFENNSTENEYIKLMDFGISKDILMKLSQNEIKMEQLRNIDEFDFLDTYEKLIIKDILIYL